MRSNVAEISIFILGICAAVIGYLLHDTNKPDKVEQVSRAISASIEREIEATEQILEATAPEAKLAAMLNDLDT